MENNFRKGTGKIMEKKTVKKRNGLSFWLILSGVLLMAGTLAWEAYRYPWAGISGRAAQSASALPDPPPIVWSGGDLEAPSSKAPDSASSFASSSVLPGSEAPAEEKPAAYVELGVIKIPKLNLSQHILEGTQRQMRYGVGHVTGTAPAGGKGNCALAGHNTTSFRYLDKLSSGDLVFLETGGTTYTYSVDQSFVVLPTDLEVLKSVDGVSAALTLITCTPYLTGTHRLIVRARLTAVDGRQPPSSGGAGYEQTPRIAPSSVPSIARSDGGT